MSAVSGTSAHKFAEVQEIQFQVFRNVSCVGCVGEPNPRAVHKKQQVKIDWALHNGLGPLYIDCSCLLLCFWFSSGTIDVDMCDLSKLVQGESSPQCWTSLLGSRVSSSVLRRAL